MTSTYKDKIIRAGMDFSISFTVNFPLFYRWGKNEVQGSQETSKCYKTQWQTEDCNAGLLNPGPVLNFHSHTACHATVTDIKGAWKMLKINI